MKKKIIILGAGLVGEPMMRDLMEEENLAVSIVDISDKRIEDIKNKYGVKTYVGDLSDEKFVKKIIAPYDMVLNAVPGFMGFSTLKAVLEEGKNVVDIAFSPEDLNVLNELAIEKGVTALVDFGVAPGLSHMTVGYASEIFDKLETVRIFVGGIPKRRSKPFEYHAVFSPIDVIEEYTRPARLVRNGKEVILEALTEIEEMEFEGIGTLEAFNSDGLRSLVYSVEADDMAEKTLRYPGHASFMKKLRDVGYFSQDKIKVGEHEIAPIDLTAALIFPQWQMKEGDKDITVMKIYAEGPIEGIMHRLELDLLDELDTETGVHSMARTTGYTATMGVRLLLNGLFNEKGLFYPEIPGKRKEILDFVLEGLKKRGIQININLKKV